jgi:hypothetical protein
MMLTDSRPLKETRTFRAIRVSIALAVSAIPSTTLAGQKGIYVEGQLDCGQWIDARTKGSSMAYENYVIGVLNGLALGHMIEFWRADGRSVSRESVYLWLDQYCRQHPLDEVVAGVIVLFKDRSGWKPAE